MPQDDPHTERDSARRQRGGSSSAEQMRGEAAAAAETMSARMADIGANSFNVGLRRGLLNAPVLPRGGRATGCGGCRPSVRAITHGTNVKMRR